MVGFEGAPPEAAKAGPAPGDASPKYEYVPRQDLILHQKKTALTVKDEHGEYVFPTVWKTSPKDIGRLTGSIGIQLYFDLLHGFGWTFLVMFLLSLPLIVCAAFGNLLESANIFSQVIARTSVANLGRCPDGGCLSIEDFRERCLWDADCDRDGSRVIDWAPYLGLCDAMSLFVFMLFGAIFKSIRIRRLSTQFGRDNIIAADYTVEIFDLPPHLGASPMSDEHLEYEAKLKAHFVDVLKNLRQDPMPDADESVIADISLVRGYNGAVNKFIQKGECLRTLHDAEARRDKILSNDGKHSNREKQLEKVDKAIAFRRRRVDECEADLKAEASKVDSERVVNRAFVTFKTIDIKEKIQFEYRFSTVFLFRLCQSSRLRFAGSRIRVAQAPDPSDLYWENLDFSPYRRLGRRFCILVMTILALLATSMCLVGAKSFFDAAAAPESKYDTWILESVPETEAGSAVRPNSCYTVLDWELLDSCGPFASSSDAQISTVFDKDAVLSKDQTGSAFWDGPNGTWTSNGCTDSAVVTKDWLGQTFSGYREVECMNLRQSSKQASSRVRLWGCNSKVLPSEQSGRSQWSPSKGCFAMKVVSIDVSKKDNNNEVASKLLRVIRDTECQQAVSLAAAQEAKILNDLAMVDCFCHQELVRNPTITAPPYNSPEAKVCEDWSQNQLKTYGAMLFSVITVLIINQLLLFLFYYFVEFMRPLTVTQYTSDQLLMLFFAQFINTALLIYLVNARMPSIPSGVKWFTEPFSIGRGAYYEVNSGWFLVVGASLVITIVSQVFTNTVPQIIMHRCVDPCFRWMYLRWEGVVSRNSLERLYENSEWNIAMRTAQTFNVVCTIIVYGGGIPILYVVGVIYTIVGYWLDKYSLLRASKRPPAYSQSVIEISIHFIPLAVVLHAGFASFVFGNQTLMPSSYNNILLPFGEVIFGVKQEEAEKALQDWAVASSKEKDSADLYERYIQARWLDFCRWGCSALMVIFVVSIAYYVLVYLYWFVLEPILAPTVQVLQECFRRTCCKRAFKTRKTEEESSQLWEVTVEVLKGNNQISSYKMKDNPKYLSAVAAVDHTAHLELERRLTAATVQSSGTAGTSGSTVEERADVDVAKTSEAAAI